MPTLFKRCKCGTKIKITERACERCRASASADANKMYNVFGRNKEADKFYQSKEWKAVRAIAKARQPFCVACGKPTEIIDHIVPIEYGGAALNLDNLQGLCRSCHNKKTAQDEEKFKK